MATTIKDQALGSSARLASKVIASSRDLAAASGDVAYTGVGFTPTSIVVLFGIDGGTINGVGIVDSALTGRFEGRMADATARVFTYFISGFVSGSATNVAIVKSFDADGFTLTWTKTGSPTGTMTLYFLCFR